MHANSQCHDGARENGRLAIGGADAARTQRHHQVPQAGAESMSDKAREGHGRFAGLWRLMLAARGRLMTPLWRRESHHGLDAEADRRRPDMQRQQAARGVPQILALQRPQRGEGRDGHVVL